MEWWLNHVGQMAQSVQDYSAKVIRHGIKQSQHGKNNVRKTGGKPSNRREEIREQKARGERNKRKRKGYKHSK